MAQIPRGPGSAAGPPLAQPVQVVLDLDGLGALLGALRERGYRLVGPTLRDGAIVYDEIASLDDLPAGWTDEQDGGTYRLRRRPPRRAPQAFSLRSDK